MMMAPTRMTHPRLTASLAILLIVAGFAPRPACAEAPADPSPQASSSPTAPAARWAGEPRRNEDGSVSIDLLAAHPTGLKFVALSVDNGPWRPILEGRTDADTGATRFQAVIRAAKARLDELNVRAVAVPREGKPYAFAPIKLRLNRLMNKRADEEPQADPPAETEPAEAADSGDPDPSGDPTPADASSEDVASPSLQSVDQLAVDPSLPKPILNRLDRLAPARTEGQGGGGVSQAPGGGGSGGGGGGGGGGAAGGGGGGGAAGGGGGGAPAPQPEPAPDPDPVDQPLDAEQVASPVDDTETTEEETTEEEAAREAAEEAARKAAEEEAARQAAEEAARKAAEEEAARKAAEEAARKAAEEEAARKAAEEAARKAAEEEAARKAAEEAARKSAEEEAARKAAEEAARKAAEEEAARKAAEEAARKAAEEEAARKAAEEAARKAAEEEAARKAAEEAARKAAEEEAARKAAEEAARKAAEEEAARKAAEEAARKAAEEEAARKAAEEAARKAAEEEAARKAAEEAAAGKTPVLTPGSGFTGPTPEPGFVGRWHVRGADAKAIARWDVVPWQTLDDSKFGVGVVAFHINDIDRVEFSLNGGPWLPVYEMTVNPRVDVKEYWCQIDPTKLPDGPFEVRAIAYPKDGVPRLLEPLTLYANTGGTLSHDVVYVSPDGNDGLPGSQDLPIQTIKRALEMVPEGGEVVLMEPGVYHLDDTGKPGRANERWITIRAAEGLTPEQVVIAVSESRTSMKLRVHRLKWRGVTFNFFEISRYVGGPRHASWFDQCVWTHGTWDVSFKTLTPIKKETDKNNPDHVTKSYVTRSKAYKCVYGFVNQDLVRNSQVEKISGDAFQASQFIVGCTATKIDGTVSGHHTDLFQYFGAQENIIIYDVVATGLVGVQAFFFEPTWNSQNGPRMAMENCAIVDVIVEDLADNGYSQLLSKFDHILFRNVEFINERIMLRWKIDTGYQAFEANNVLFDRCRLHPDVYAGIIGPQPAKSLENVRWENCYISNGTADHD